MGVAKYVMGQPAANQPASQIWKKWRRAGAPQHVASHGDPCPLNTSSLGYLPFHTLFYRFLICFYRFLYVFDKFL